MNTDQQEHYLWACAMIADEARELTNPIRMHRQADMPVRHAQVD